MIVRKHRLWEVFLVEKLQFSWDEVHEIAEELEHIKSESLIDKLDEFLGFPDFAYGSSFGNRPGLSQGRPLYAVAAQTWRAQTTQLCS